MKRYKTFDIDQPRQDCWRKIGIWGNESTRCEKLKLVKHCRNCEVFEQATRVAMTERRIKSDGSDLTIEELVEKKTASGNKSLMPFRISNQCFAVPCSAVTTISDKVAIHSIPHNQSLLVKGLVAINHEVYTFISLEDLLGLERYKPTANESQLHSLFNRMLVVDFLGREVVFYVDEVYQIYRYFENVVRDVDSGFSNANLLQGVIENSGSWCGDCHILNLGLVSNQLALSTR
ncbi:MAG TPA: chemotaxis protein CheW [Gammaproteobacteria bacterium]|nr:chemotaxis protein CheW [Gammaproteobacteria bacterium]